MVREARPAMKRAVILVVSLVGAMSGAHGELVVRGTDVSGHRLIYDSILDVTWYDLRFGTTPWPDAVAWADDLVVEFGGKVYGDWRLPKAEPVNGVAYDFARANDGSADIGRNIVSPNAELSHLFYVSLANEYLDDDDFDPALRNRGPFESLEYWYYWYGSEYQGPPRNGDLDTDGDGIRDTLADTRGFFFLFSNGNQSSWGGMTNLAMAVRDGDVSPIPVPAAGLLAMTGVIGMLPFARRRTKRDG